jgi:hypothetical protein
MSGNKAATDANDFSKLGINTGAVINGFRLICFTVFNKKPRFMRPELFPFIWHFAERRILRDCFDVEIENLAKHLICGFENLQMCGLKNKKAQWKYTILGVVLQLQISSVVLIFHKKK